MIYIGDKFEWQGKRVTVIHQPNWSDKIRCAWIQDGEIEVREISREELKQDIRP